MFRPGKNQFTIGKDSRGTKIEFPVNLCRTKIFGNFLFGAQILDIIGCLKRTIRDRVHEPHRRGCIRSQDSTF